MLPPTETGNNILSAGIKCVFRLADPAPGQPDARQQITSILLTEDGCFISVSGKSAKRFYALTQYDFGMAAGEIFTSAGYARYREAFLSLLKESGIPSLPPGSLTLAFLPNRHTLVPGAFYNTRTADQCFSLNFKSIDGEILRSDYIRQADAYMVYGVPPVIADIVSESFPDIILKCSTSHAVEWMLSVAQARPGKMMLLDILKTRLKIIACENDNLLFCNDFEIHAAEDIVYYSLFVASQLGQKDNLSVWISGNCSHDSRPYQLLRNYFENVSFVPQPQDISFSQTLQGVSWNEYFTVLNSALCEL